MYGTTRVKYLARGAIVSIRWRLLPTPIRKKFTHADSSAFYVYLNDLFPPVTYSVIQLIHVSCGTTVPDYHVVNKRQSGFDRLLIRVPDPHPGFSGSYPNIESKLEKLINAESMILSKGLSHQSYRRDFRSAWQFKHGGDQMMVMEVTSGKVEFYSKS